MGLKQHTALALAAVLLFSTIGQVWNFLPNFEAESVPSAIMVGDTPLGIAVNPSTNMIYVTNSKSDTVSVINGATNAVVATIKVGDEPDAVALNQNTNMIYISNTGSSTVSVIDGTSNSVVATISLVSNPAEIAINPNTNMVYLTNPDSNTVSVINGANNKIVTTIKVGDFPVGVAVNPSTNMIYVVNVNSNSVSVIDGSTNKVVKIMEVGYAPWQVAVNPSTNMIYVVFVFSDSLSVIDGSTNSVVKTIALSGGPIGIDINPSINIIYVVNSLSNTVSVIDGSANDVVRNIEVGDAPQRVAINLSTNMIYVANAKSNSISVMDGKSLITGAEGKVVGKSGIIFDVPDELQPAVVGKHYSYSFCLPEPTSDLLCGGLIEQDLKRPIGGVQPFTFMKETLLEIHGNIPFGLLLHPNGILEGTPIKQDAGKTFKFKVCAIDNTRSFVCDKTKLKVLEKPKAGKIETEEPTATSGGKKYIEGEKYASLTYKAQLTLDMEGSEVISGKTVGGLGTFHYSVTAQESFTITLVQPRKGADDLEGEADAKVTYSGSFTSNGGGCPTSGSLSGSLGQIWGMSFSNEDKEVSLGYNPITGTKHPSTESPEFDAECIPSVPSTVGYALVHFEHSSPLPLSGGSLPIDGKAAFGPKYSGSFELTLVSSEKEKLVEEEPPPPIKEEPLQPIEEEFLPPTTLSGDVDSWTTKGGESGTVCNPIAHPDRPCRDLRGPVQQGDIIKTGTDNYGKIPLHNGRTTILLGPNHIVKVFKISEDEAIFVFFSLPYRVRVVLDAPQGVKTLFVISGCSSVRALPSIETSAELWREYYKGTDLSPKFEERCSVYPAEFFFLVTGTEFTFEQQSDKTTRLTVLEGEVQVWKPADQGVIVTVGTNQQLVLEVDAPLVPSSIDPASIDRWWIEAEAAQLAQPQQITPPSGGGCLIATAAFGSELTPQVQFLRNFRDERILSTLAGSSFMNVFNLWYYSFSPNVASAEREIPVLQQMIKYAIYPLLGILTVAEKVYSVFNGEAGAITAGFVTSSMIGFLYFWPIAYGIGRVSRRRLNSNTFIYAIIISLIGVVAAILISEPILLMITTSAFVVTIVGIFAIISVRLINRLVSNWRKF